MTLYFAYGSNMSDQQMAQRCPQSRKLGQAKLVAHRWIIAADGYASVVPSLEDAVEGVLFEVSSTDESALDMFEDVQTGGYRKCRMQVQYADKAIEALVYINSVSGEGSASPEYKARILVGLADAGISETYIARYVQQFMQT